MHTSLCVYVCVCVQCTLHVLLHLWLNVTIIIHSLSLHSSIHAIQSQFSSNAGVRWRANLALHSQGSRYDFCAFFYAILMIIKSLAHLLHTKLSIMMFLGSRKQILSYSWPLIAHDEIFWTTERKDVCIDSTATLTVDQIL